LNVNASGNAGSYFLPQCLAGSPSHPSSQRHAFTRAPPHHDQSHADVGTPAESSPWPYPVVFSERLSLVTPTDTNLTVLGELNKLAANVSEEQYVWNSLACPNMHACSW